MGNTPLYCHSQPQQNNSILNRQLSLYKWRLQNIHNNIPKIQFKHQFKVKQQQKLTSFINQNKSKQYIQVDKLKQELDFLESSKQSIIVFQKYVCTLDSLSNCLGLEECIYTLLCLLTAFEHIKKVYRDVPISKYCCFVTVKGQVRGWINSNPKSNQIQQDSSYDFFEERQYRQIVEAIINLVQQLSLNDLNIGFFFDHLKQFIKNIMVRSDIFECTRRQIENYCFKFRIERIANLGSFLRRRKETNNTKFKRKSNLSECQKKDTSVGTSQDFPGKLYQVPSHRSCSNSIQKSTNTLDTGFHSKTSHFLQIPNKTSTKINISYNSHLETPKTARTYEQHKKSIKHLQTLSTTSKPSFPSPAKSQTSSKAKIHLPSTPNIFQVTDNAPSATLLQSKLLSSKELSNLQSISYQQQKKHRRNPSNFNKNAHKNKIVSILDLGQDYEAYGKENQQPKVRFQTAHQVTLDERFELPHQALTTRTIQRQVAHESQSSLAQSKGQVSQSNISYTYSAAYSQLPQDQPLSQRHQ